MSVAALGDQGPGKRWLAGGDEGYQGVQGAKGSTLVYSLGLGDNQSGRRRGRSGGVVTAVVGRANRWCSGEVDGTRS